VDVSGWLTSSITITALLDFDITGAPVYLPGVTVPARIQPATNWVTSTKTGAEVQSKHIVYTQTMVGIEDRIFLPGDNVNDPSVAKVPIRVMQFVDKNSSSVCWKVIL